MSGGADIETAYRASLKRERDRDRSHRQTKQGEFEAAFVSLDQIVDGFADPSKTVAFSDGGAGADAIIDHCDGTTPETLYARRLKSARDKLRHAHPEWLEVFNLIVRNGSNRKESIWALMSKMSEHGMQPRSAIGEH